MRSNDELDAVDTDLDHQMLDATRRRRRRRSNSQTLQPNVMQ